MMEPREFFDLDGLEFRAVFDEGSPVWSTLGNLKPYLARVFESPWPLRGISGMVDRPIAIHEGAVVRDVELVPGAKDGHVEVRAGGRALEGAAVVMPGVFLFDDRVVLGPGTVVEPGALIKGPLVVGRDTEIRQGAYVRGDCLVGSGCVIGHTTEVKASILLDGAKAGHFAYIGDSILGRDVNLGAGTKLANLKMIPGTVAIRVGDQRIDTGRRKLGAVLGDRTEAGCNSVTSPGTLVGPRSIIYPTMAVPSGYYPARTHVRPGREAVQVVQRGG
jgi:carbonic anhydrase/acetyltransferase-like protein (isoleucine patch superfamily)